MILWTTNPDLIAWSQCLEWWGLRMRRLSGRCCSFHWGFCCSAKFWFKVNERIREDENFWLFGQKNIRTKKISWNAFPAKLSLLMEVNNLWLIKFLLDYDLLALNWQRRTLEPRSSNCHILGNQVGNPFFLSKVLKSNDGDMRLPKLRFLDNLNVAYCTPLCLKISMDG